MVSQTLEYLGGLRCTVVHGPSRTIITTDAPTDNFGCGEYFSPTDLVVSALSSCIITTMAILAQRDSVTLDGSTIYAEKHMSVDSPRRISNVVIRLMFCPGIPLDYREKLEAIARTCPVAQSLNKEIVINIEITYPD
ncbi:MAG: OsmC family protein [bacterium]